MLTQVSEWRDGKILLEEQTHRFQIGNPTQIFPSRSIHPQSFLLVNTFCTELSTFVKQPFFTPIELECDHLSWQLSDDDQWSLASSDAMSVSVNPLKAKEKTAPNRHPIMIHTRTKHGHKLTGMTYSHKQVHKFPFCNCKATEIQMIWSQSEQ
jgi:hypothetical protein